MAAAIFDSTAGLAVAGTYRPAAGGADVAVRAIISRGQGDEYRGSDTYGVRAVVRILVSEVAAVHPKDLIIIAGESWRVIGADKSSDGMVWIIEANKVAA